jgi:5-methylcytosine-specific restriction endonuclease McrA
MHLETGTGAFPRCKWGRYALLFNIQGTYPMSLAKRMLESRHRRLSDDGVVALEEDGRIIIRRSLRRKRRKSRSIADQALAEQGPRKMLYSLYLKTSHWRRIRERTLQRDRRRCVRCQKKATDIHHLTYVRLGREDLNDLVSVCRDCHLKVHENCLVIKAPKQKLSKRQQRRLRKSFQIMRTVNNALRKGHDSKDPKIQKIVEAMRWRKEKGIGDTTKEVMRSSFGYKFTEDEL